MSLSPDYRMEIARRTDACRQHHTLLAHTLPSLLIRDIPALLDDSRRLTDLQRALSDAIVVLNQSGYFQPDLEAFAASVEAAVQESQP